MMIGWMEAIPAHSCFRLEHVRSCMTRTHQTLCHEYRRKCSGLRKTRASSYRLLTYQDISSSAILLILESYL